jgi:hypothetical protein
MQQAKLIQSTIRLGKCSHIGLVANVKQNLSFKFDPGITRLCSGTELVSILIALTLHFRGGTPPNIDRMRYLYLRGRAIGLHEYVPPIHFAYVTGQKRRA